MSLCTRDERQSSKAASIDVILKNLPLPTGEITDDRRQFDELWMTNSHRTEINMPVDINIPIYITHYSLLCTDLSRLYP